MTRFLKSLSFINRYLDLKFPLAGVSFIISLILLSSFPIIAQKKNNDYLSKAYNNLYTNPKKSSYYASALLRDSTSIDDRCLIAEAMLIYANAEQLLGNFDLSAYILHDVESYINPDDKRKQAQLYSLKGRVFAKLGDYPLSADFNDKATSIYRALGDSARVASCYNERGVMLLFMNEYQLADHYFKRALNINREHHNLRQIAGNLNNMCLYEGETEAKLEMIDEAITINRNLNSIWSLGENYNNKAKQLYYAGRYGDALEALDIAYAYADSIGAKELLSDNYEYRSHTYAALNDYRNAYANLARMDSLRAVIQGNTKLRNLELEIARKKELDAQQESAEQKRQYEIKLLTRNFWIFGLIAVMIIIAGLVYYKWYKHRENMKLIIARSKLEESERELAQLKLTQKQNELESMQSELEANSRELTNFAAFLKSRNDMLEKLRDMLKAGYKLDPSEMLLHLKRINTFVLQYCHSDKTESQILLAIEARNRDFLKRLNDLHPDLTAGEKSLALLLRGNLSSKEIAAILGTQPKSIIMSRYRLRKSLALGQEDDLDEYLKKI